MKPSITQSQVPSACRRATSAVTSPSGIWVEVSARSPQILAAYSSPTVYLWSGNVKAPCVPHVAKTWGPLTTRPDAPEYLA